MDRERYVPRPHGSEWETPGFEEISVSALPAPTEALFREDARLVECTARIVALDLAGVQLDRKVFYPQGGGQAGDADGRGIRADPGGDRDQRVPPCARPRRPAAGGAAEGLPGMSPQGATNPRSDQ